MSSCIDDFIILAKYVMWYWSHWFIFFIHNRRNSFICANAVTDVRSFKRIVCRKIAKLFCDGSRSHIQSSRPAIVTSWAIPQRIITGIDGWIEFCAPTAHHDKATARVALLILAAIARIGQYILFCLSEQIVQLALNSTAKKRE